MTDELPPPRVPDPAPAPAPWSPWKITAASLAGMAAILAVMFLADAAGSADAAVWVLSVGAGVAAVAVTVHYLVGRYRRR